MRGCKRKGVPPVPLLGCCLMLSCSGYPYVTEIQLIEPFLKPVKLWKESM